MIQLKIKNLNQVISSIENYKKEIEEKTNRFVKALAESGVQIATLKILENDAIFTGELSESMEMRPGDTFTNGSQWIVFTGCRWAKYVEFGTGIIGARSQHYDATIQGWEYDINHHGEDGWWYQRDDEPGKWRWTKGMPSRPFMYETALELYDLIQEKAREVFG